MSSFQISCPTVRTALRFGVLVYGVDLSSGVFIFARYPGVLLCGGLETINTGIFNVTIQHKQLLSLYQIQVPLYQNTTFPPAHGPNTSALTSMLSLPSASGRVLGSSNAVWATLPPFTDEPSLRASLSKHSKSNLSSLLIPLK